MDFSLRRAQMNCTMRATGVPIRPRDDFDYPPGQCFMNSHTFVGLIRGLGCLDDVHLGGLTVLSTFAAMRDAKRRHIASSVRPSASGVPDKEVIKTRIAVLLWLFACN